MSQKKIIDVSTLPKGGPYSHAVIAGNLIFVSGQTGQNSDRKTNFEEQFNNAMNKIKSILEESGSSLDSVVKATIFLADSKYFKGLNQLYGKFFKELPPARTTIVSGFVVEDILVEIDIIATL